MVERVLKHYKMYIDGVWTESVSGESFESYDPSTGEAWCTVAKGTEEDVDRAVASARRAFESPSWSKMTFSARGRLLHRLGDLIAEKADDLAQYETRDNGKLIREMRGQLRYLPEFFYYFAGIADKIHGDTLPIDKADMFAYTLRESIGVVAAITPWNSPLYLTTLKLAPALAAGNTIVIKPSEHTSASLLELVPLIEEAGFPPGVVNIVTGFGNPVGNRLTTHPDVGKIAFTGGSNSARQIIKNSASNFARLSLELGGKSPNIVFEDANIGNAAMGIVSGIFAACGQSCVAGSRAYLHESVFDAVLEQLVDRVSTIRIGDPLSDATEMGPIGTLSQLNTIRSYVDQAISDGANLVYGGAEPHGMNRGWYYLPTIISGVSQGSRIVQEEIFGPILSVIPFKTEEEVLELANGTRYGLAAGVWTKNLARAHRMTQALRAGIIWVNTYRSISPIAHIGGSGLSGYGREGGTEAIYDYTQSKVVWINTSEAEFPDPFVMR